MERNLMAKQDMSELGFTNADGVDAKTNRRVQQVIEREKIAV